MSRLTETTGTFRQEAVSPRTEINWNPQTNDGSVLFHCQRETWLNGEFQGLFPDSMLVVPLADILASEYAVQMPDGSEVNISGGLLMLAIKTVFNSHYSERAAALAEATP